MLNDCKVDEQSSIASYGDPLEAEEADEIFDKSIRCFSEHRIQSLSNRNTLMAAIGTVTADLLEVQAFLAKAIRNQMRSEPIMLDELDKLSPPIDLQIRLTKQISQLAHIEIRGSRNESPRQLAQES
jgi:cell division protein ZapA (FtsZ GTPase activity inhibitor)